MWAMHVETKFLRLFRAVNLGDEIDGWRVCWLGGGDKGRVLFVVMVERGNQEPAGPWLLWVVIRYPGSRPYYSR